MGKKTWTDIFQRKHRDGQQAHDKKLSIPAFWRNANQNHSEGLSYTCHQGHRQKSANTCWRGCGEKGILQHHWWECTLMQTLWKTVWSFLKKIFKMSTTTWSSKSTPKCTTPKHSKTLTWKYTHSSVLTAALFVYNRQDVEATQMPINKWLN